MQVVPTVYTGIRGHTIESNQVLIFLQQLNFHFSFCFFPRPVNEKSLLEQFSVTEHFKSSEDHFRTPPGVFFFYDLSPIKVSSAAN